jgi:hypothetical protein
MTTMGQKITVALVEASLPIAHITEDVIKCVMKLMEEAYSHGWDDGSEDAEVKHKNHVMQVLRKENK